MKICLINPFYGTFPFWMPAFFLSCASNPSIQWNIVTDITVPEDFPDNVQFTHLPITELNRLISKKLGLKIQIDANFPYKLTDFRPAYGVIFEDYFKDFDYWGHCDLDVIWGDLETFIRKENLEAYDIFTSRVNKISGHLCIYRNANEVNELFKKIPRLQYRLKDVKNHYSLDEKYFSWVLSEIINPNMFKRIWGTEDFVPRVYWHKHLTTRGVAQRLLWDNDSLDFLWHDGKTYHVDGSELMYIHFHKLKHMMEQIDFDYGDELSKFTINRRGIFRQ